MILTPRSPSCEYLGEGHSQNSKETLSDITTRNGQVTLAAGQGAAPPANIHLYESMLQNRSTSIAKIRKLRIESLPYFKFLKNFEDRGK
jgi:hypothetical protein